MASGDVLTAKHLEDWRTNGYLILRAAEWLSPTEQQNIETWMEEVLTSCCSPPPL